MDDVIHAVLTVYDRGGTYARHAGVVMTSAFEHTKSNICFHIIHDDTLTAENREKLTRTAAKYGQRVEFADVSNKMGLLGTDAVKLTDGRYLSRGSLFRILIPDVIGGDRVIYLDCDIVVALDLAELWEFDLGGRAIGAVSDIQKHKKLSRTSRRRIRFALIDCSAEEYFNSGVLLMDLARIREKYSLSSSCTKWFRENRKYAFFPDQDYLNATFAGDTVLLPDKFNVDIREHDGDGSGIIIHAVGKNKPWNSFSGGVADMAYWSTLMKSAWGDGMTIDDLITELNCAAAQNENLHTHNSQCWKRVTWRLLRDTFIHPFDLIKLWVYLFMKRRSGKIGSKDGR